jgi:hypothetical protein
MGADMTREEREYVVQVSGFSVAYNQRTQSDYMLVGLTNLGRVIVSNGDNQWGDITPKDRRR